MVKATSTSIRYQTSVTNGHTEVSADTIKDGVGGDAGLRPHELLEAALASCMNITVRLKADEMGLALAGVYTEVALDRSEPGKAAYRYHLQIDGQLTEEQREILEQVASHCPVRRTLLREPVLTRAALR